MSEQKLIGLIGGTSWSSTILYYDLINKMVREKLGGLHSARIMLYSIDYHPLRTLFYEPDGWKIIPGLLQDEFKIALKGAPDCLILGSNVLHKAFDEIEPSLNLQIPFFHAAKLSAQALKDSGVKRTLLLANLYTMENDFFADQIRAQNILVGVPNETDRQAIHAAQTKLAAGENNPDIRAEFAAMLKRYENDYDAVALACTELPMAVDQNSTRMKVFNPMQLQCTAAVNFALGENHA